MKKNGAKPTDSIVESHSKEFFDKYSNYAGYVMENQGDVYQNTKKLIDKFLVDAKFVLDVGNGGVINYAFKNLERLDCLDISISDSTKTKYRFQENVQFIMGDALHLPFDDDQYDVAILQYVLHHLAVAEGGGTPLLQTKNNVKTCISELLRVVKPGGKVLIIEPVLPNWMYKLEERLFGLLMRFCRFIKHDEVFQYSAKALTEIISNIKTQSDLAFHNIDVGKSMVIFKIRFPAWIVPQKVYLMEISK
jgi:ubiquinone/menaquinone biosynthesis C-methylase UbiE